MSGRGQDDCDILVIGGGLTGLTCAMLLHEAGHSVMVVEAADRLGGRVHSLRDKITDAYLADLGPTWVWPEAQPFAASWIKQLGLGLIPQFESGDTIVDIATHGSPARYQLPGMEGSYRIQGGTTAIVERLLGRLPSSAIRTSTRVNSIAFDNGSIRVSTDNMALPVMSPRRVVVATPMRVAASTINWSPALDSRLLNAMETTPTWMAAQAKAVAIYSEPFWRTKGLSGRIASRLGPLVEAHDHSGEMGKPSGLFGFIGLPPKVRHDNAHALKNEIVKQLVRCFGEDAAKPDTLHVEDWAENPFICTPTDITEPPQHPQLVQSLLRKPFWDDRIFFAVAELATVSPGLIEGAFHIGTTVAKGLSETLSVQQADLER